jgi:hypothetical protein
LGIAVSCVKLVRKMYGLPCLVIAAASPPVKLGTSAFRVSAMLTRIEPENTGPKTAKALSSMALVARPLATPGLDCVSATWCSIFLPRMPPASLISLTAISTPFLNIVPDVAPAPESSYRPEILIVFWAWAPALKAAMQVAASRVLRSEFMMAMSPGGV